MAQLLCRREGEDAGFTLEGVDSPPHLSDQFLWILCRLELDHLRFQLVQSAVAVGHPRAEQIIVQIIHGRSAGRGNLRISRRLVVRRSRLCAALHRFLHLLDALANSVQRRFGVFCLVEYDLLNKFGRSGEDLRHRRQFGGISLVANALQLLVKVHKTAQIICVGHDGRLG